MIEEWRDFDGKGNYLVSSQGKVFNTRLNRLSKINYRKDGYGKTTIYSKSRYIHRIVAETFLSNTDNKPQISHLNGNTRDNQLGNLNWATAKENCALKKEHGTAQIGSRNSFSKLSEEDVLDIRHKLSENINRKFIAFKFGISNSNISDIKKRKTWKHI